MQEQSGAIFSNKGKLWAPDPRVRELFVDKKIIKPTVSVLSKVSPEKKMYLENICRKIIRVNLQLLQQKHINNGK